MVGTASILSRRVCPVRSKQEASKCFEQRKVCFPGTKFLRLVRRTHSFLLLGSKGNLKKRKKATQVATMTLLFAPKWLRQILSGDDLKCLQFIYN